MGRQKHHFHAVPAKDVDLNLIGGKRQTQIKKHSAKQLACNLSVCQGHKNHEKTNKMFQTDGG